MRSQIFLFAGIALQRLLVKCRHLLPEIGRSQDFNVGAPTENEAQQSAPARYAYLDGARLRSSRRARSLLDEALRFVKQTLGEDARGDARSAQAHADRLAVNAVEAVGGEIALQVETGRTLEFLFRLAQRADVIN